MAKKKERGALQAVADELAKAHGKDWTGSQFVTHVREKHPALKNPDGSVLQAWNKAKAKLGMVKKRGRVIRRKPGRRAVSRIGVVGNGVVSVATIQFVKLVGGIAAAKAELEALEKVLGDGTLPF